jgi:NADH:ubiquinone oxidoreductase subunit 5 (subunit L)/multisubunit Na+/H+ antiporter MnhA subunit
MILACGLSYYNIAFFHLFNHAFFKALLFLSAGSVIHLMSNEQDIRRLGGLASLSPFVYVNVLIGSLALAGFPFLSGFYSKDLIIEISNTEYWVNGQSLYWLSAISAILTMYYSIRLLVIVFLNKFNGFHFVIKNHIKVTNLEIFLLGFLCFLSILTGYTFKEMFTGFGSNYFGNVIHNISNNWTNISLIYTMQLKTYFENCKWFYNEIVNVYLVTSTFTIARISFDQYEKRVLDYHGPLFLVNTIKKYAL